MEHRITVFFIGFASIALSTLLGFSEEAGLFGASLTIGVYLAAVLDNMENGE